MYRVLDAEQAVEYMAACPPLDAVVAAGATLQAREVGDGNLNLVFIVTSTVSASAVLKQALPYVRMVGESWPLTIDRNRYERQAYAVYAPLVPDLVPHVYHEDDALALFVMEDLSRLRIVRHGLIQGWPYPRLAGDIARFAAETLVRTSDFYLASAEKKALVSQFINPEMCKITEDLVLTDPFHDAPANKFEPALLQPVEELWADEATRAGAEQLRYTFQTRAEALLHGDLHTGSVMASPDETRVVDPEFCFFGPPGFDVGMFIANLFLNALSHWAQDKTMARRSYAVTMIDAAAETWSTFATRAACLLDAAPVWRLSTRAGREYMQQVLRDATGFAGAEMIRRTIGLAHVDDLDGIVDDTARLRAKGAALALGRRLITAHPQVDDFAQVLAMVRQAAQ